MNGCNILEGGYCAIISNQDIHQSGREATLRSRAFDIKHPFLAGFKGYRKHYALALMFLPVVAYFVIFKYVPMYGVTLAFKNFNISKGILASPWNGLENYRKLFRAGTFLRAVRNTAEISLLKLVFGFPMPIILALLLNELRFLRFKKIVQTISYLPHFLSWIILAGLFMQLFSPSSGPVNYILQQFGVSPIYFMADNNWFRFVLIITEIWKGMGWGSIVYLAAIAGINQELYEAAECDGAGRFLCMWYITIPLIAPTIAILFILNLGGIMDAGFDQIFNLYSTVVYESADIIDTYVYRYGLGQMQYSNATAVGLFKNAIGFALVIITNAITKKLGDVGIW